MAGKGKTQATRPIPDWATLRPPVTDALLADITRRIVEKFQPYKVVLFGSYAYGMPDLDSDVDLLVVMDSDEPMAQRIRWVMEVAKVRFLPMDIRDLRINKIPPYVGSITTSHFGNVSERFQNCCSSSRTS